MHAGSNPAGPTIATKGDAGAEQTGPVADTDGPLTQWQSGGLLIREFRVRAPDGPRTASVAGATGQRGRLLSGRLPVRVRGDALMLRWSKRISRLPLNRSCRFKPGTEHSGPIGQWLGRLPFKQEKAGRNRLGSLRSRGMDTSLGS